MYDWDGYIYVDVYRNAGVDCTLGGVTSDESLIFVVPAKGGNVTEEELGRRGYVILEPMKPAYDGCPVRFKPRGIDDKGLNVMAGGNFVYTCDSRFSREYGNAPVSVHDRAENW